jgi:undecaprenyl-phosphate galactose phosphotransferase/putative colanic acid biosynthesis UDP-glucose lipid carrier transferase
MNVKALKLRLLFSFGDVFHLTLAFLLAYRITFFSLDISDKYLFLLVIVNLSWLLLGFFFGLFDYERASRFELVLSNLLKAVIVHALITSTLLFSLKTNSFSYDHLYYTFGLSYLILFVWRIFSVFFIKKYRRLGYNYKEIVHCWCC